jgi:stage II sporulation protein D
LSYLFQPHLKNQTALLRKKILIIFVFIPYLFFISCSSSKRFTSENDASVNSGTNADVISKSKVRVLLEENSPASFLTIQNEVYLYKDEDKLAHIRSGNTIQCYKENYYLKLIIQEKEFEGDSFELIAVNDKFIQLNGTKYRGNIFIYPAGQTVGVINILSLEDYVKGVLTKEMPVGTGEQNFEALKAVAICIRTYAINRIEEGKSLFDLFKDTRDQVYGGLDSEHPLANKAVDETKNLILEYNNKPAIIYYHSTCGGMTESAENVFNQDEIPYLKSIEDGDPPYCSISNRFSWEEDYDNDLLVKRLIAANLLDEGNYSIEEVNINSRFISGRVNELEFLLQDGEGTENSVKIYGNSIRNILKTADGTMGLWSTLFDVNLSGSKIIINGKGFGHGVGLCQWGAIGLSRSGKSYKEILEHYYPGTEIESFDD